MHHRSSGQILLITLLVLTVGMTISLALISRTRTDVTINNEIEDSARAFSAAEAGIERALQSGLSIQDGNVGELASFNTTVTSIGEVTGSYTYPQKTLQGNVETLWLVNHDANGVIDETRVYTSNTIDVCWIGTTPPALSIGVLYKRVNSYLMAKAAFDPSGRGGFADAGGLTDGCGQTNVYKQTITFSALPVVPAINVASDTLLAIRIRPIYADANIFINSLGDQLPSQGDTITSTGITGSGITRKVIVARQFRSAPSIFDAAVVSQTNFTH